MINILNKVITVMNMHLNKLFYNVNGIINVGNLPGRLSAPTFILKSTKCNSGYVLSR